MCMCVCDDRKGSKQRPSGSVSRAQGQAERISTLCPMTKFGIFYCFLPEEVGQRELERKKKGEK